MPVWMERGARLGHWMSYSLLVTVPLTAILDAWFEGHPLTMLAMGNIQPWFPQSRRLPISTAGSAMC